MSVKTIDQLDVAHRRVLVRVDFNVPIKGGAVTDDTRVRAEVPTIQALVKRGARVVLCSHMGRPKGKPNPEYSLAPAAGVLEKLLGKKVQFAKDCVGPEVEAQTKALKDGEVLLLENTRFYAGEEKNDAELAKKLAALGDVFVNDAFGAAHRAHASTAAVASYFKDKGMGYLMAREMEYLGQLLAAPKKPFWAVLGGAKVSDKLAVVQNLLTLVDGIVVGGAMALTFLAAQGKKLGTSKIETDQLDVAKAALDAAAQRKVPFLLPVDHVVAEKFDVAAPSRLATNDDFPQNAMALDIGPKTRELYAAKLKTARTIFWNGPMGVFEMAPFAAGTVAVAKAVAASGAVSVVGGGDSVAAVAQAGVANKISHISTGGGASLEMLEGRELPGYTALKG